VHHNAGGHAAISRQDKAISFYIRKSNTLKIFHRTSKLSLFFYFYFFGVHSFFLPTRLLALVAAASKTTAD